MRTGLVHRPSGSHGRQGAALFIDDDQAMAGSWSAHDWLNQGGALLASDPALARRLLAQGLQLTPEEAIGWYNLGLGLHQQRRIAAAVRAYQHCLTLPHAATTAVAARNNLAQDMLLLGHWHQGWELYSHRFERKPGQHPLFSQSFGPALQGPIAPGRPLLLMSEQGLGDTLQFARYALVLQQQGHDVTLLSHPPLVALLQRWGGLRQVVDHLDVAAQRQRRPAWLPLLDLAPRLSNSGGTIPMATGYLKADPERVTAWRQRLQRRAGQLLVALHWQGNPDHEHSLYSRGRSMRFEHWLGLGGCCGVEFVSIQKGAGSEQLAAGRGLPLVAGQAAVSDSMEFCDTAAVLANCDLLISADSSVVHLAGALGVPTWLALRWIPEWRWGLTGDTTPWYSSVRLFRQHRDGDWASVVQAMRRQLARLTQASASP
jgi:tetratricopeptide (TPR) repeat protein